MVVSENTALSLDIEAIKNRQEQGYSLTDQSGVDLFSDQFLRHKSFMEEAYLLEQKNRQDILFVGHMKSQPDEAWVSDMFLTGVKTTGKTEVKHQETGWLTAVFGCLLSAMLVALIYGRLFRKKRKQKGEIH